MSRALYLALFAGLTLPVLTVVPAAAQSEADLRSVFEGRSVRLKKDVIEFQLDGGGYGTFSDEPSSSKTS